MANIIIILLCVSLFVIFAILSAQDYKNKKLQRQSSQTSTRNEVITNETLDSMKNKIYICPCCSVKLKPKLYPSEFYERAVVFRYYGQPDCPHCDQSINWKQVTDSFSYAVCGDDRVKEIANMPHDTTDWVEWIKNYENNLHTNRKQRELYSNTKQRRCIIGYRCRP